MPSRSCNQEIQLKIDFPNKKRSSRSRNVKDLKNDENETFRRTRSVNDIKESTFNGKNSEKKETPKKGRKQFEEITNKSHNRLSLPECSPPKQKKESNDKVCKLKTKAKSSAIAPVGNQGNDAQKENILKSSPKTNSTSLNTHFKSPSSDISSPFTKLKPFENSPKSICRSLTFSPTKSDPAAKVFSFYKSPEKQLSSPKACRNLFDSPSSKTRTQHDSSSNNEKRQLFMSPNKDSPNKSSGEILNSKIQSRNVNCSPCKSNIIMSPVRASPRKRVNYEDNIPKSPIIQRESKPMTLAKQEFNCYKEAKISLHTAPPDTIVGRESERTEVQTFLENNLNKKTPASIYISGAPGTGKTAILSKTIQDLRERDDCQVTYVNCMSFKNSQAIFNRLLSELQNRSVSLSAKIAGQQLEEIICSDGIPIVMILDEVDQLDSKNQEVLYTMFEWPALENSRVIMIGIANALDLTDRILPRLQALKRCKPKIMNFAPYNKDQIMNIIKDRLQFALYNGECIFDTAAIRFCAMKVSAVAGDIRKALDICRRAVEMVEIEVRKQQVIIPAASPRKSPRKHPPPLPKKIGVVHIAKIVSEVYGSRVTSLISGVQTVPLQQKLAICTLLLIIKNAPGKSKEVTMGKFHEKYSKICKKQEVTPIDQTEFISLCNLIEARGIMGLKLNKEQRNTKVTLKLDEKELEAALQDKVLIANILKGGLP